MLLLLPASISCLPAAPARLLGLLALLLRGPRS
jgi:hypothetical protein